MELINRYCHGYVAVAIILNLDKKGVFAYLEEENRTLEELCTYSHANVGHFNVALNLLLSLGWLEYGSDEKYILTEKATARHKIPKQLLDLYHFSASGFLVQAPWKESLHLIQPLALEKGVDAELLSDMCKGVVLAPLLLSLESEILLDKNFSLVEGLFIQEKWLEEKAGSFIYTPMGGYLFKRIAQMAVTVSYQPMFSKLDAVLFGDVTTVFGLNSKGHESHIDRQLNVIGSGFQHHLFFEQFKRQVIKLFNGTDFANQPAYIADMGCGDGSLLKALYVAITAETPRGKVLERYPLMMIGADFNEASLQETIKALEKSHVPYITIKADVGDPKTFIQDLEKIGIDPHCILHVRSFLDHDRPYISPNLQDAVIQKTLIQRKRYFNEGVFVNQQGEHITPEVMMQSLVEHLGRWGNVNIGYGLILSEVHYLSPYVVRDYISESENLSFDACQGFSKQYLVTMKDFLLAAAENGLFTSIESFTAFPKNMPFCRIGCLRLEKKPYKIRYAHVDDADILIKLEERSWDESLRNASYTIKQRLLAYPQGHWILEIDQKIVGVIYTQRLKTVADVCKKTDKTVDSLHDSQGQIMQILNLLIDPECQHLAYDAALRDFVLLMAKVTVRVTEVIDVTRCRSYAENRGRYPSLKDYMSAKDSTNLPIDPTLNFHARRGASIVGLIANYRIKDEANNKAGILVRYNIEKIFANT